MTKTLIKSRVFPNKNTIKTKPDMDYTKSTFPPNLQSFKQKLLSGKCFIVYK